MTQMSPASLYRGISPEMALLRQPGRATTPADRTNARERPVHGARSRTRTIRDARPISEAVAEDCDHSETLVPAGRQRRRRTDLIAANVETLSGSSSQPTSANVAIRPANAIAAKR